MYDLEQYQDDQHRRSKGDRNDPGKDVLVEQRLVNAQHRLIFKAPFPNVCKELLEADLLRQIELPAEPVVPGHHFPAQIHGGTGYGGHGAGQDRPDRLP